MLYQIAQGIYILEHDEAGQRLALPTGGMRPRRFDGTNFKPHKRLDCPKGVVQSGASVAPAYFAGDWARALSGRMYIKPAFLT
jgi:hypothetical protein